MTAAPPPGVVSACACRKCRPCSRLVEDRGVVCRRCENPRHEAEVWSRHRMPDGEVEAP